MVRKILSFLCAFTVLVTVAQAQELTSSTEPAMSYSMWDLSNSGVGEEVETFLVSQGFAEGGKVYLQKLAENSKEQTSPFFFGADRLGHFVGLKDQLEQDKELDLVFRKVYTEKVMENNRLTGNTMSFDQFFNTLQQGPTKGVDLLSAEEIKAVAHLAIETLQLRRLDLRIAAVVDERSKKPFARLDRKIKKLQVEKAALEKSIDERLTALDERSTSLESAASLMSQQIAENRIRGEQNAKRVDEIDAKVEEVSDAVNDANDGLSALDKVVNALEKALDDFQASVKAFLWGFGGSMMLVFSLIFLLWRSVRKNVRVTGEKFADMRSFAAKLVELEHEMGSVVGKIDELIIEQNWQAKHGAEIAAQALRERMADILCRVREMATKLPEEDRSEYIKRFESMQTSALQKLEAQAEEEDHSDQSSDDTTSAAAAIEGNINSSPALRAVDEKTEAGTNRFRAQMKHPNQSAVHENVRYPRWDDVWSQLDASADGRFTATVSIDDVEHLLSLERVDDPLKAKTKSVGTLGQAFRRHRITKILDDAITHQRFGPRREEKSTSSTAAA